MSFLRNLPARPRAAAQTPNYPRRAMLSALALAASAAACNPIIVNGNGTPVTTGENGGYGGEYAGGIAEPWGGAGGVGGSVGGGETGGRGGETQGTGGTGPYSGGTGEPWGTGGWGGQGGAGGTATISTTVVTTDAGAGGAFGGDVAEGWDAGAPPPPVPHK